MTCCETVWPRFSWLKIHWGRWQRCMDVAQRFGTCSNPFLKFIDNSGRKHKGRSQLRHVLIPLSNTSIHEMNYYLHFHLKYRFAGENVNQTPGLGWLIFLHLAKTTYTLRSFIQLQSQWPTNRCSSQLITLPLRNFGELFRSFAGKTALIYFHVSKSGRKTEDDAKETQKQHVKRYTLYRTNLYKQQKLCTFNPMLCYKIWTSRVISWIGSSVTQINGFSKVETLRHKN